MLLVLSPSSGDRDLVNHENHVEDEKQKRKKGNDDVVNDENAFLPGAGDVARHIQVLKFFKLKLIVNLS